MICSHASGVTLEMTKAGCLPAIIRWIGTELCPDVNGPQRMLLCIFFLCYHDSCVFLMNVSLS